MKYEISGQDIILYEENLSLSQTLDCGQAFRWEKVGDDAYFGYYIDRPLYISGSDGRFVLKDTTEDDFLNIWYDYFDLGTDYSALKMKYCSDPTLKKACACSGGTRLLKQDGWETLISYIFSSNNNIPRIKGIISRLTEHYKRFPTPDMLAGETPESLGFLRSGFRAKYVIDAAKKVLSGEVSLSRCRRSEYGEAKSELMKINGVGPKVADCVLLYGLNFRSAFPVDVWIKRVMQNYYSSGLPECTRGTEGIAQLYLFNYIRSLPHN